jgi:hypothetical protein
MSEGLSPSLVKLLFFFLDVGRRSAPHVPYIYIYIYITLLNPILLTHKHYLGLITINNILTKYPKTKVYGKLTKNSSHQDPMLGKLLATPNHTKSRENTKLN